MVLVLLYLSLYRSLSAEASVASGDFSEGGAFSSASAPPAAPSHLSLVLLLLLILVLENSCITEQSEAERRSAGWKGSSREKFTTLRYVELCLRHDPVGLPRRSLSFRFQKEPNRTSMRQPFVTSASPP